MAAGDAAVKRTHQGRLAEQFPGTAPIATRYGGFGPQPQLVETGLGIAGVADGAGDGVWCGLVVRVGG